MTVDDDSVIGEVSAPSEHRPATGSRMIRAWIGRCMRPPILLTALIVAAAGLFGGLFYFEYRSDQQTDNTAARLAVTAASDGATALLSYSADTLQRDFTNAKSRLTGSFLSYYQQFSDQVVTPMAQRGVTTTTEVIRAAVSELHPNSAVVLVFVNQKTLSKDKPEPVVTPRSIRVALAKIKGSWLIEQFEAV